MNIAFDVRVLAKGRRSGIEEYTKLLLESCFEEKNKDIYTLLYNSFSAITLPETWMHHSNIKIKRTHIPNKLLDITLKFLHVPKIGGKGIYDVVVSPHFNLLHVQHPTKHIMTFHDLSFFHFPKLYSWRKQYWHWMQNYYTQAMHADHIVAVSEFTKHDLIETLHIPAEKITVIYSGVNPLFQEQINNDEYTLFRKKIPERYILSVGVLEPRKNIPALIHAFEYLKQQKKYNAVKLILVGERGWLYHTIEKAIATSPYRDAIIRWGSASYQELQYLYHGAEVFVYPSLFEGFGFPPLEAQSCGTPVIASNRSSLPEIVGNSALLVDPYRTSELVYALDAVMESQKLRETLRIQGLHNVTRFTWKKSAQKLLHLCHTI